MRVLPAMALVWLQDHTAHDMQVMHLSAVACTRMASCRVASTAVPGGTLQPGITMCRWLMPLCAADPLRVLRAVRFGARFDFRLDSQLEEAAASPQVGITDQRAGHSMHCTALWRRCSLSCSTPQSFLNQPAHPMLLASLSRRLRPFTLTRTDTP